MSRLSIFSLSYRPLVSRCTCFKTTFNGWDGELQIGWSRFLVQLDNFFSTSCGGDLETCHSTLRTTLNRGRPSQMTVLET